MPSNVFCLARSGLHPSNVGYQSYSQAGLAFHYTIGLINQDQSRFNPFHVESRRAYRGLRGDAAMEQLKGKTEEDAESQGRKRSQSYVLLRLPMGEEDKKVALEPSSMKNWQSQGE